MKYFLLFFLTGFSTYSYSQCLEITSFFIDACGSPEGENEMFTFNVNSTNLDINDISVAWPNVTNPFLGWTQNATTATITSQLNATITGSCGLLIEPPAGIIPANKKVIVITSTDIDINANSFDGLVDTLYIIYQTAGNTQGHFVNYNNASGIRTMTITVSGGCTQTETASYNRNLLVNINGGYGGTTSEKDGATVLFDIAGNATYVNNGCTAPISTNNAYWDIPWANIGGVSSICSDYGIVNLNDLLSPNATTGGNWNGVGVINDTTFNPIGLIGSVSITYTIPGVGSCITSADSTITFNVDTISSTEIINIEDCGSVVFQSNTFFADSTFIDTIVGSTAYACDSFYQVNITINFGISDSTYYQACDSFLYNGIYYTADTILRDTVTGGGSSSGNCSELFISEYAEGSSNNKYIEIYNGTGSSVNLSNYSLERYANGSSSVSSTQALSGMLADADVFIVYHPSASAAIISAGDLSSSVIGYNGDDAMALRHNGSLIDLIGNIGCDPGTAWTNGILSTRNKTIYRNANYTALVTTDPLNVPCDFPTLTLSNWAVLPQDDLSNIGFHTANCGNSTSGGCDTITITNIVISNTNLSIIDTTICAGDSLFLANAWQNTAGIYYDTILGAGGTTTTDTIFTETFDGVQTWTLNTTNFPAQNGADPNFWTISDNEAGVLPPGCGVAGGGNKSMHITSVALPTFGAAYDVGGFCGFLYCPMTNTDATSPNISTVGYTNIVLTFDYIANGQGLLDNASLLYSDDGGTNFTVLDNSLKTLICGNGQGQWTAASYNLPVSTENISDLQIRFNWVNNDDGAGTNPSVAINNVRIAGDMASSGGCDTIVQTNLAITNVVVANTIIITCDSAIVNGTSYYASSNFNMDSLYNANGCLTSYTQVSIDIHYSQSTNSSASICAGDSIFLANAWQNTAGIYYDTLQTNSFPNCDSIIATTLAVNNCTTIEASFIPSTATICAGDSITFTDNSTGTGINSWNWIFAGTPVAGQGPHTITFNTAGTYSINLLIGDGTITDDTTIVITVNNIATSTVNTSACDSLILLGNTYYANATINDTLASASVNACDSIVTYQIIINNSVSNIINNTSCSPADTGTVVQNLLTMNGCDSVLTTITTLVPITTTTQNTTTCTNNSSQAGITTDTILSVGGCDSIYNVSTVIFQNIQNISLNSQEICEGESAVIFGQSQTISDTYTNTISSSLGCDSVVESIELIVNPLPNIDAGNDETINAGNTITLTAEGGDTYIWSTNETNQTITISPTQTSTYFVTGTDANNCINSDTIIITVIINEVEIQIPTAFSPNGDGLNDTFRIVNQDEFEDIKLRVYNRWGELVFASNKGLRGWDGTYKSIAQELDSYIYYIEAKSKASGQVVSVSGSIALIR